MAILTTWITMDNKVGVDLNNVQTSITTGTNPALPEVPTPRMNLGDRVQGSNGSEWMFVQAGVTVTAFNFLVISRGFSAQAATSTLIASGVYTYGIAQWQPFSGVTAGNATGQGVANTSDFFWALVKANQGARINITASVSTAPGNALYISPSIPGFLTTSATASRINGLLPVVSAAGGGDITVQETAQFTYIMPAVNISVLSF